MSSVFICLIRDINLFLLDINYKYCNTSCLAKKGQKMLFSSSIFIFGFLPIVILVHYVIREQFRNYWIVLSSVVFYLYSQPIAILILLVNVAINYSIGILLNQKKLKIIFITGIIFNLLPLFYFKYTNFVLSTFLQIVSTPQTVQLLDIILPIGISFYTFKGISYLSDIYTNKIKSENNIINVAIYIMMFPQILSGPIERFSNISDAIKYRDVSLENMSYGIQRFIIGLSKKVIIADSLGSIVDMIWSQGAGSNTVGVAWLGSLAYSLQIYFDFSGYTDMAIGIGHMLGFKFMENFNLPYISKSIAEFWRRWHISLGLWFKDYLYIPLGGNRKHVLLNIAIVFFVTGIWHGASWTFVLWGCIHGFFRLVEQFFKIKNIRFRLPKFLNGFLLHIYLLLVINLSWILFRAPDLKQAFDYFGCMLGVMSGSESGLSCLYYLTRWNSIILILGMFFSTPIPCKVKSYLVGITNPNIYLLGKYILLFSMLVIAILNIITSSYKSFIYFQF